MIQPHNRHMSFSLYISALSVTDTIVLVNGNYFQLQSTLYLTAISFFTENFYETLMSQTSANNLTDI